MHRLVGLVFRMQQNQSSFRRVEMSSDFGAYKTRLFTDFYISAKSKWTIKFKYLNYLVPCIYNSVEFREIEILGTRGFISNY